MPTTLDRPPSNVLPPDAYFDDYHAAHAEAQRRRAATTTATATESGDAVITRVQKSPYGGYVVRTQLAELLVDALADAGALWLRRPR